MGALASLVFAFLFAAIAIYELKAGKALLRPFVTKESSPIWYWLEVSVGLFIAGGCISNVIGTN